MNYSIRGSNLLLVCASTPHEIGGIERISFRGLKLWAWGRKDKFFFLVLLRKYYKVFCVVQKHISLYPLPKSYNLN